MPQTFSFATTGGARLCLLVTITRRDGTVFRVCDSPTDVTIPADATWVPAAGLKLGSFSFRNNGTVPSSSFDIMLVDGGSFNKYDVLNQQFEGAQIEIDLTNADSPVTKDFWFVGTMTDQVSIDLSGLCTFGIRSAFGLQRDIFVRTYNIPSDTDFGDPLRCKVPTWPYRYTGLNDLHDIDRSETVTLEIEDTTPVVRRRFNYDDSETPDRYHNVYWEATAGGTTGASAPVSPSDTDGDTVTDGTVTWTVRNAYVRAAEIASVDGPRLITLTDVPDPRAASASWFVPGRLRMWDGYSKNRIVKTSAWDPATKQLTLVEPLGANNLITAGDLCEVAPDCNKSLAMCVDRYDNGRNYRGFPHLTGDNVVSATVVEGTTPFPGPTDDPEGASEGGAVEFFEGED